MPEQTESSCLPSKLKFLENKEIMRIVVLMLGLGGIFFYFSKKNNELRDTIDQLSFRVDEQDEKIDALLRNVGGNVLGIPQRKKTRMQQAPVHRAPPSQSSRPPPQPQQPQHPQPPQSQPLNPLSFLTMFMQPSADSGSMKTGTVTEVEDEKLDEVIGPEIQELKEAENEQEKVD